MRSNQVSHAPGYFVFTTPDRCLLVFGFLMTFFSSFGQTFFISLFGGEIRDEFSLSHGEFGLIFSVATLSSGLMLMWLGRLIDHIDLRVFTAGVCAGLTIACAFIGLVAGPVLLGLAIFFLRFMGQALMVHTAMTSLARYFDVDRGKAISIANLGIHGGRGVFPMIAIALAAALGWRGVWLAAAAMLAVALVPLMLWLLKGHGERHRRMLSRVSPPEAVAAGAVGRQWTLKEVVRDPRFYFLIPLALSLAFTGTGIIFHQVYLVQTKGWDLAWFAGAFIGLATSSAAFSLLSGPLVDRVGSRRLVPYFAIPAFIAIVLLATFDHPLIAYLFMILFGISEGISRTVLGALWAELYGVLNLGAIRGLLSALAIIGTSLSPILMGWLIDLGISLETILYGCAVYVTAAIALAILALRHR